MELPVSQLVTDEKTLREHMELAKSFAGTMVTYCREHNLDYDKFMYYRSKKANRKSVAPSGFIKVEPKSPTLPAPLPTIPSKNYQQLPDPHWLAELIHNLVAR